MNTVNFFSTIVILNPINDHNSPRPSIRLITVASYTPPQSFLTTLGVCLHCISCKSPSLLLYTSHPQTPLGPELQKIYFIFYIYKVLYIICIIYLAIVYICYYITLIKNFYYTNTYKLNLTE